MRKTEQNINKITTMKKLIPKYQFAGMLNYMKKAYDAAKKITVGIEDAKNTKGVVQTIPLEQNRYYAMVDNPLNAHLKIFLSNGALNTETDRPILFNRGNFAEEFIRDGNVVIVSKPEANNITWMHGKGIQKIPTLNGTATSIPINQFDFYLKYPFGYVKLDNNLNVPSHINASLTPYTDKFVLLSPLELLKILNTAKDYIGRPLSLIFDLLSWLNVLKTNPTALEKYLKILTF